MATNGARGRPHSGQALLEFALVVPILILLVMAIFQFAYVLETQNGLTNAVREAARRAAATSSKAPVWGNLQAWTLEQLNGTSSPPSTGLLATNVSGYDAGRLVPAPTVTLCRYMIGTTPNFRVKVDVQYEHPIFFGPLAFATDLLDSTPGNGFWDLSATAQMRLESVDPSAVGYTNPPVDCP